MEFRQSKTYSNLLNAYELDLMSSASLLLSADQARREGYIQISNILEVIALNEREHARIWQRNLNGGILPDTEENLLTHANMGADTGKLYREYARVAREEGYDDISSLFNGVANIELNHDLTMRTQYNNFIRGEVFCKPSETLWICLQCGNIMNGLCAPIICPVCGFPQGYYQVYNSFM